MTRVQEVVPCPHCGRKPDIGECGPWPPSGYGPTPWYASCFKDGGENEEHFIGVNADTQAEVRTAWNNTVAEYRRLKLALMEGQRGPSDQ